MPSSPTAAQRPPGPSSPAGESRVLLVAAIAAVVIALDAGTKILATQLLTEGDPVKILGGLVSFDLYRNYAGPNNILAGHTVLISVISIVASIALIVAAFRVRTTLAAVAVGLLLGGAIGNLLDRLLREPAPLKGGVIDWLRLAERTNSMNLADLALNGAIVVVIAGAALTWWRDRQSQ